MATYIRLSNFEYPLFEGDIRNEHPEIKEEQTWPNFPCPPEFALVNHVDKPQLNSHLQYAMQGKPEQKNNQWYMTWEIKEITQEKFDELEAEHKRIMESRMTYKDPRKLNNSGTAPNVVG